jgi:hypothetical protein
MKLLTAIALALLITAPAMAKDKTSSGDKAPGTDKAAKASEQTSKAQNNADGRSAKSKGEANRATPASPDKK